MWNSRSIFSNEKAKQNDSVRDCKDDILSQLRWLATAPRTMSKILHRAPVPVTTSSLRHPGFSPLEGLCASCSLVCLQPLPLSSPPDSLGLLPPLSAQFTLPRECLSPQLGPCHCILTEHQRRGLKEGGRGCRARGRPLPGAGSPLVPGPGPGKVKTLI